MVEQPRVCRLIGPLDDTAEAPGAADAQHSRIQQKFYILGSMDSC